MPTINEIAKFYQLKCLYLDRHYWKFLFRQFMEYKAIGKTFAVKTGRSGVTLFYLIYWLEVSAVQVERHHTEMLREKRTGIMINEESEFGPLGKYL